MKIQNLLFLIIFFIVGCNNDDNHDDDSIIETDAYLGRFCYGEADVNTQFLIITEKLDNSVIINTDTLEMTSDSIQGNLKLPWSANGLYLKGKYSGKVFKLKFNVDGTFTEAGYNHGGSYTYSGTFSITLE